MRCRGGGHRSRRVFRVALAVRPLGGHRRLTEGAAPATGTGRTPHLSPTPRQANFLAVLVSRRSLHFPIADPRIELSPSVVAVSLTDPSAPR